MDTIRTVDDIKRELVREGRSIAELARSKGLRPATVYDLLGGRVCGSRGESHRAAVLLGLKEGEMPPERRRA